MITFLTTIETLYIYLILGKAGVFWKRWCLLSTKLFICWELGSLTIEAFPTYQLRGIGWMNMCIMVTYLWPMIGGFYIADMVRHGEYEKVKRYLADLHRANRMKMDNQPWSFPEFIHGSTSPQAAIDIKAGAYPLP